MSQKRPKSRRVEVRAGIVAMKRRNWRGAKDWQEGECWKSTKMKGKPTEVKNKSKQVGEVRSRWGWTESSVWTDSMLTALENGVKGGKWYSLIDKVWSEKNLMSGFKKVKSNRGACGVDGQSIHEYERRLDKEIAKLSGQIRTGSYFPQAIRRKWIPKVGTKEQRPLGIPTVRDRIVQTALRNVIEPVFERKFSSCSYGFRPGKSCKDALREVERCLKSGNIWVVDADIKSYFDNIPHDLLMKEIEKEISDGRILELIRKYLKQEVMDGMKAWSPEEGTPQGAIISPLLANIYLNPFDHFIEEKGFRIVRYADDFVILCKSREEAHEALETVSRWMSEAGLKLHPEKTRIVDARNERFEFLGYRFDKGRHFPRKKSLKKFKDKIRGKTKRTNGQSLKEIIASLNSCLIGWFGYYKHCNKWVFKEIDGWIRMRLRSILRKRQKRRGRAKGFDNQRWPNKFFEENGLFSLYGAYLKICQSRVMS